MAAWHKLWPAHYHLHIIINSRRSWKFFSAFKGKRSFCSGKNNLRALNGVVFWAPPFIPSKLVFSDASSTGCAAFIQGSGLVFHTNWSLEESQKSSTWRELATIKLSLEAFDPNIAGHRLRWYTDNQNVVRVIRVGSMIKELHELAVDIFFSLSKHREIQLDVDWIPRDQNVAADRLVSRITDYDDYSVHDDVFMRLDTLWGPHSIDRFACSYNAKLPRFNSRFLQPGSEAVDAFSQDWALKNNWLVPPVTLIGRVLRHMRDCKAFGTLIVPMWKSAYFWTLLCEDGVHFNSFIHAWVFLPSRPDLFVPGKARNRLFGTKAFKPRCLALRIDYRVLWDSAQHPQVTVLFVWVRARLYSSSVIYR